MGKGEFSKPRKRVAKELFEAELIKVLENIQDPNCAVQMNETEPSLHMEMTDELGDNVSVFNKRKEG